MNTRRNNSSPISGSRLVAFLVVLLIGLALGWWNGSTGDDDAISSLVQHDTVNTQLEETETSSTSAEVTQQTDIVPDESTTDESPTTPSADVSSAGTGTDTTTAPTRGPTVKEDGWYTSKDQVALYIHTYGRLPGNFISKTKARKRGWVSSEGNLDEVCPGMSIGGSRFYNDDGALPDKQGRQWTECDINYHGGYRGAERIVFSNDGLIFYTADHYKTFEQLY